MLQSYTAIMQQAGATVRKVNKGIGIGDANALCCHAVHGEGKGAEFRAEEGK